MFDIIDNRPSAAPFLSAEAILVGRDLGAALAPFLESRASNVCVRLGHTTIVPDMLKLCGVDTSSPSIREVIRKFSLLRPRVGAQCGPDLAGVKAIIGRISETNIALDEIDNVYEPLPSCPFRGLAALADRLEKLRKASLAFGTRASRHTYRSALGGIKALRKLCGCLFVLGFFEPELLADVGSEFSWCAALPTRPRRACAVFLDLGLLDRHGVYSSGLIFDVSVCPSSETLVKPRHVKKQLHHGAETRIAEGGQYDSVLASFHGPAVGIGMRSPLCRLARKLASQDLTSSRRSLPVGPASILRPFVLVAGQSEAGDDDDSGGLAERLLVANMLWDAGVSTEYINPVQIRWYSLDQLSAYCKEKSIQHLVVVKPRSLQKGESYVRHQNILLNAPFQNVHLNDLISVICSGGGGGGGPFGGGSGPAVSAGVATKKSKKNKKRGSANDDAGKEAEIYRCPFPGCDFAANSPTAITTHQISHLNRTTTVKLDT